jgi:hypothetical protein
MENLQQDNLKGIGNQTNGKKNAELILGLFF